MVIVISKRLFFEFTFLRFSKKLNICNPDKKYKKIPNKDSGISKKYENTEFKTMEQFSFEQIIRGSYIFDVVK